MFIVIALLFFSILISGSLIPVIIPLDTLQEMGVDCAADA